MNERQEVNLGPSMFVKQASKPSTTEPPSVRSRSGRNGGGVTADGTERTGHSSTAQMPTAQPARAKPQGNGDFHFTGIADVGKATKKLPQFTIQPGPQPSIWARLTEGRRGGEAREVVVRERGLGVGVPGQQGNNNLPKRGWDSHAAHQFAAGTLAYRFAFLFCGFSLTANETNEPIPWPYDYNWTERCQPRLKVRCRTYTYLRRGYLRVLANMVLGILRSAAGSTCNPYPYGYPTVECPLENSTCAQ